MRVFASTRRLTAVAAALAVTAGTAVAVSISGSAGAAGSTIVGVGSGRCLAVVGDVRTARTPVDIHDCTGQADQAWTITPAGELRVYDDQTCLDVAGNDTTAPARVQIYPCHGGANQRWRVEADGRIVGIQSGLCLDVVGGRTDDSAPVQLWTCHGGSNQRWRTSAGGPDTSPPSVPGNPRVSGLLCDAVTFTWDAATDDVGVAHYDVYHDGQLMTTVSGSTLSTGLVVVPGATWGLYVNARDAAGNVSQASTTVPITPPQCQDDTTAPTTPTGLAGSASGTTVTLRWTASTDDVGVRAYDVYRGSGKVGTVTGTPPATTYTDSGLAAATTYQYTVVARDAVNSSARSGTATVTTGAACGNAVCGVTQVATDTDVPWGLAPLPDGSLLYSRRDAHDVVRLDPATGAKTTLGTVPNVRSTDGEGGLLGLAVAANHAADPWLYVMHTSPTDNRVVRIRVAGNRLNVASTQVLVSGIRRNKYHNGGRLRFGPDGKLYASTGDAQNAAYAQDRAVLEGKILRVNPDGSVPADNPFGNLVWSYGHRNPQGLAFDAQGRLWAQEFGNSVMDETNLVTRGGNYGWPACEGTVGSCAGYVAPKRTYPTSEGSCSGIAIVGDALYVACLRGTRLYRAAISGDSLIGVQSYFTGTYGRLRSVEPAAGGGLWLTTSTTGDKDSVPDNSSERILRVTLGG